MPAHSDSILLLAIATAVAGIDQLTKAAVVAAIGPSRPDSTIALVESWIALEYTENRGAAFGLFPGLAPILVVLSIVIVAGLLIQYVRASTAPLWSTIGLGAIAGGAVGNLVDRLRLGYVVDFVSVGAWPNFNVADSAITIGVLILLWGWLRPELRVGASNIR